MTLQEALAQLENCANKCAQYDCVYKNQGKCKNQSFIANANLVIQNGLYRLARYEATGLSPEEIVQAKNAMKSALALACEVQAFRAVQATCGIWNAAYRSGMKVSRGFVSSCCDMWSERASRYCPYCGAKMELSESK